MTDVEFTFQGYEELLARLQESEYTFASFDDPIDEGAVLMRHDVDWSPRKAVHMAEIEAEYDVTSTYFFLVSSPFYNVMNGEVREQIARIASLGHDVGLHFSTHQYFDSEPNGEDGQRPPDDDLTAAIDREREVLSVASGESIDIVSFHNPPEWVFRRSFETFISTYEQRFFEEIVYRADSNQRWRDEPPFEGGIPPKVQILTHPVLWGESDGSAVDRLREERDYLFERIHTHLVRTDRTWENQRGMPNRTRQT